MAFELQFFSNPDGNTVTDNIDAVDSTVFIDIRDNNRETIDRELSNWEAKNPGRKVNRSRIQVITKRG